MLNVPSAFVVMRFPLAYVLANHTSLGVDGIWWAMSVSNPLGALLTITWFLGGLVLIAAAAWFEPNARRAAGICIGSLFLLGALGNFWGTRGRHPGWMLMTLAVILIAYGVSAPGD